MDDAEHGVAVLGRLGDDAQRDEVVDLVEADLLPPQLLVNRPEALEPAVDRDDGNLRLGELGGQPRLQGLHRAFGRLARRVHLGAQRLIGLRFEVPERQLLELVLELAHPEPVRDRRVDVARLLRDPQPPLLRQVVERAHVVQPIGQLHQDDADVVDHREQHLAEALGLPLFARRKLEAAQLGDALDDVGDILAEQLADLLDGVGRVLDDVVQQARRRARPRRGACRPGCRPPRAGGPGTAPPIDAPAPCAAGPRTRRPSAGARCRHRGWRPAPFRSGLRTESS